MTKKNSNPVWESAPVFGHRVQIVPVKQKKRDVLPNADNQQKIVKFWTSRRTIRVVKLLLFVVVLVIGMSTGAN